jgi:hypothetical protein
MSIPIEKLIDEVIEAGWGVLKTNFDEKAFAHWRQSAYDCIAALLAPDHPCFRLFQDHVNEPDAMSLLTGGGILYSVRELLTTSSSEPERSKVLSDDSTLPRKPSI